MSSCIKNNTSNTCYFNNTQNSRAYDRIVFENMMNYNLNNELHTYGIELLNNFTLKDENLTLPPLISIPSIPSIPSLLSIPSLTSIPSSSSTTVPIQTTRKSQSIVSTGGSETSRSNANIYKTETNMTFEIRVDSTTHRYICSYIDKKGGTCPKSYKNKRDLLRHFKLHEPTAPKCSFCGKKFTRISYLNDHIRTHTGEKPFICHTNNCNKRFKTKRNLSQHQECHLNVKQYRCGICNQLFKANRHLQSHRKRVHVVN